MCSPLPVSKFKTFVLNYIIVQASSIVKGEYLRENFAPSFLPMTRHYYCTSNLFDTTKGQY
jgi:hypothetical protein